ncbi:hypothetical protein ACOSQ2_015421 [Xanthoceras sorbifolium]
MPGTIIVSVLDFKGLQSTPPQISIKVSMGKREYQTWDKEDFSFPLTTLRDNLMIALHDAEGNEISYTGIETRLVVEKGLWDDIFLLEGGGHVHLKLQFVLSEEERNRIRVMRESALRKKREELLSRKLRSPANATIVGSKSESSLCLSYEVSDPQKSLLQSEAVVTRAGLVSTPVIFIENAEFGTKETEETFSIQKQTIPIDARIHQPPVSQGFDIRLPDVSQVEKIEPRTPPSDFHVRAIHSEEASPSSESSELVVALKSKLISPKLKEDGMYSLEKQYPVGKTPSNVRNMITAFESSLAQDTRPMKPPPANFQSSNIETAATLESLISTEGKTETIKPTQSMSGRIISPFQDGESQQASTYTRKKGDQRGSVRAFIEATPSQDTTRQFELSAAGTKTAVTADSKNKLKQKEVDSKNEKNYSEDLMRASAGKAATVSGRMLPEHIGRQQPGRLFGIKQHSGGKLSVKESGKGLINPEALQESDNQRALTDKMKFKENWKDKHYSFECPGTWIFPVESRHLCITTCNKETMDLIGHCHTEAATHLREKSSAPVDVKKCSIYGVDIKVNEGEKTNQKPKKSKVLNSADGEPSRGPVGQAVRAAIMIGFATLVIFTRQKKQMK